MKINLKRNNEEITYNNSNALYILLGLIPFVGMFIVLVLAITRKQFRGFFLNWIILKIISGFTLGFIFTFTPTTYVFNIAAIIIYLFLLYVLIDYVIYANLYSVKQRLAEGFYITNEEENLAFIEEVNKKKVPVWQITKF